MSDDSLEVAKQQRDALFAEFGEAVTTWNFLEGKVRNVLTRLISRPEEALLLQLDQGAGVRSAINRARILTANLPNATLTDTIRIFAKASRAELGDHLVHLTKVFDRLREHRNFYVHGIQGPGSTINQDKTVQTVAFATMVSARGSLSVSSLQFGLEDLRVFRESMVELARYIDSIIYAIINPDPEWFDPTCVPLESLQKPPVPDRLLKTRQFLIGE
jgi:hypothetical protein